MERWRCTTDPWMWAYGGVCRRGAVGHGLSDVHCSIRGEKSHHPLKRVGTMSTLHPGQRYKNIDTSTIAHNRFKNLLFTCCFVPILTDTMSNNVPYVEMERRLADALKYKAAHPTATYRYLQDQFKVDKDKICRRYRQKQRSRFDRETPSNTRLSPEQDKALCYFLNYLAQFGIPLVYRKIASAANHILQINNPEANPVGVHWPKRWIQSHPEFKVVKEKPIEQARAEAMNVYNIRRWFSQLENTMRQHDIYPEDFWNMDEMGLRIGVGRGQWVVVPADDQYLSRFSHIIGVHGDREQCTVVESVSAAGESTPPLVIIKGVVVLKRWFAELSPGLSNLLVGTSDSGYSNDTLFFQWLQHWEHFSGVGRRGEYRLLLLDGYDSHLTYSALKFCEQQKVVVFLLPPHTSHFLQPLDVSVLQQWKHHHSQVLDRNVRRGVGPLDKNSFFACLEGIRQRTLTERVIKAGFRKCGYFPFRPRVVLEQLIVDGVLLDEVEAEESGRARRENSTRERQSTPTLPSSPPAAIDEPWSSPSTYTKLTKQADAIQHLLRSSVEPPEPVQRQQIRQNVSKFMNTVKAKSIVSESLTDYVWGSSIAQSKAERRKNRRGTQVQKGGVVYAKDVDRDLAGMEAFLAKLGENLTWEQKVWVLRAKTMVNAQFAIHPLAKKMKEIVEGKVKLRPEHWKQPGAVVECKLGWTSWATKGMGRGNAPRTKGKGKIAEKKQEALDSEGSDRYDTAEE